MQRCCHCRLAEPSNRRESGWPASQRDQYLIIKVQPNLVHLQTSEATAVEVERPKDGAAGQESGEAAGSREAADPASQPADSSASAPYLQPAEQVEPMLSPENTV